MSITALLEHPYTVMRHRKQRIVFVPVCLPCNVSRVRMRSEVTLQRNAYTSCVTSASRRIRRSSPSGRWPVATGPRDRPSPPMAGTEPRSGKRSGARYTFTQLADDGLRPMCYFTEPNEEDAGCSPHPGPRRRPAAEPPAERQPKVLSSEVNPGQVVRSRVEPAAGLPDLMRRSGRCGRR